MFDNFTSTDSLLAYNQTINCTGRKALTDLLITRVAFCALYAIVFTVSISGNSLVVYVVLTSKNMQTVTNCFIANLAVSDLLVCCTSLWLTPVYTYVGHWIWGGWLCYGLPLFQGTSIFISTLTLMSIAIDRYFVICHHSKSSVNINEHMSMQVCIAIITLIWCVSLLLVMPYAVHMRMAYVQEPCDFWLCIEDWALEDLKSLYGIIVITLQFAVPFVIIGHSYTRIWQFLNQRRSLVSERDSEYENNRKRRLLRMLVTMVAIFAACWFPFNLLNILRDLKVDGFIKPYFSFCFLLAHLISMTATCWNPILYAWMNEAFRDEFMRAVPCLRHFCRRLPSSARPRIITDCEPATNRVNCSDNFASRKQTLVSSGTPSSLRGVDGTSCLLEYTPLNGKRSESEHGPFQTNSPRKCSLFDRLARRNDSLVPNGKSANGVYAHMDVHRAFSLTDVINAGRKLFSRGRQATQFSIGSAKSAEDSNTISGNGHSL